MRILVLDYSYINKQIARGFRQLPIQYFSTPLSFKSLSHSTSHRIKYARRLLHTIEKLKPDMVLDLHGLGILPLDQSGKKWIPSECHTAWCVWWWDTPYFYTSKGEAPLLWLNAMKSPNVRHFIWDEPLSREYSLWFHKKVHWLPTGVDPESFAPNHSQRADESGPLYDVSFLGTYSYGPEQAVGDPLHQEIEYVARAHIRKPKKDLLELSVSLKRRAPRFHEMLERERRLPIAGFSGELALWKSEISARTGCFRRNACLQFVRRNFRAPLFVGENWPEEFAVTARRVINPRQVGAYYRNSFLCLDPGNGQSFTGTALRSYEIMASGGLLVCRKHPDFDPAGELDGAVYIGYSTQKELLDIYRIYREQPRKTKEVRENCRDFAASHHSWAKRLAAMVRMATA
jgi:glycosyltransferase involved in cell wall biosynthesis